MIEQISYRYCLWDDLPLNESPIYATLRDEYGVKVANRYARRMVINLTNHPPPEVTHVETARNHTYPVGAAG